MIEQIIINRMRQDGGVRYTRFAAPTGDIFILGNDSSLKALIFRNSYPSAAAIDRDFKKGRTECINRAVMVLDDYFNKSSSQRKAGTDKSVIKVIVKDRLLLVTLNSIPLTMDMSCFTAKEISVYHELLKVPSGATISYGLLAQRAGIPGGARFAGNAMAKNNFPIIIPCHRVIKSDGSMGNYSGGIHIKKYLLDFEKNDKI
jgi:O-6-methylguanine DNA methyltransferase